MPTLTTTVEDFSPVIFYSGSGGNDWRAGNSSSDSSIDKYSDSSYMVTQVANASLSFTFSGTGVQLFGAQRANHGLYQVTINSHVYPPANGKANGTEEVFQTQLFQTVALENGLHTVTIVNLGTTALDLDFITWETPIGRDNELLLSSTIQDSDPSFKYTPASAWTATPDNIGTFNGGSGHATSTPGTSVEYTFEVSRLAPQKKFPCNLFPSHHPVTGQVYFIWDRCSPHQLLFIGSAVAMFGPAGPQGSPYSVQLDNGAITNYSSLNQFYRPQTMLFQAGNLRAGVHTVRLVSEAWNNPESTFAIDYAQVFSTPSLQHTPTRLATGSIVAIALGIMLAFVLVVASYLFYRHRRYIVSGTRTILPFRRAGYHPPMYSSHGQLPSQPTTPLPPIQSSNSEWPTGGTAPVQSKMINSQTLSSNPQPISVPYVADRKYRPDMALMDEPNPPLPTPSTSSHSVPQITLLSPDYSRTSFTTEQGGGRQGVRVGGNGGVIPFVLLPGPAPPGYDRKRP